MKNRTLCLTAVLALTTAPLPAYTTWKCLGKNLRWKSDQVRFNASNVTFPPGNFPYTTALIETAVRWNMNPSNFRYLLSLGDTSVGIGNNENEIWATADSAGLDDKPAVTFETYRCTSNWFSGRDVRILEEDPVFNTTQSWTSSTNKSSVFYYGGNRRPFRTTAMHELGHAQGLGHESRFYNVMGTDYTHIQANGPNVTAYPGEDASSGSVHLYGGSNTEDVGVTHWRWSSADAGYSVHARTTVFNASGLPLPQTSTPNGEPMFIVSSGQTVQLEMTYENNGATAHTVSVDFYLSSDDLITTADQHLGATTMRLSLPYVVTMRQTVQLPALTPGSIYYLGVILDKNNTLAEQDEANNATYVAVQVR